MPELPDLAVYYESLQRLLAGETLQGIRIRSPFVLRTVSPSPADARGAGFLSMSRIGKRLVFHLEGELYMVMHLMVAGRLHWKKPAAGIPARGGLAAFDFNSGTLLMTESSTKKRASLHIVRGAGSLRDFDRGGVEVLRTDLHTFAKTLKSENHTLKRSLTDPRLFAGIGNSYSDEILHHAKLSPLALTSRLSDGEIERLHDSCRSVISEWIEILRRQTGQGFPEKVTAFREGMAVHGRYGQLCPTCTTRVQRIVYMENECNYCPRCQTGGRVYADRSLSRILKGDWPRNIEEMEELQSSMPLGKGTRSNLEKKR
jgi:formamidopyrimidine-DNA glycosylase